MSTTELSIIIPALNEQSHLEKLLEQIEQQQDISYEIIVCDGGSTDSTLTIAEKYSCQIVKTAKGRAKQMNAGAKKAQGEFLLFLHADSEFNSTVLLSHALSYFKMKLQNLSSKEMAGHFKLKFNRSSNQNERAYRYAEEKTAFNRPYTTNGDQGLLLTKDYFQKVKGFNETLSFMEDQDMAEKIRTQGHLITLPGELKTSARRFEVEGFHKRYILMSIMMGLYWTGAMYFFKRAPGVYKAQKDTEDLQLTPFFNIIWIMLVKDMGLWGSIKAWFLVGRYVRHNSWQMFYFFDIWLRPQLGPNKYPFLKFHDKVFWPITNNWLCDAINTVFSFTWFMLVLGPYFWVTEKFLTPRKG